MRTLGWIAGLSVVVGAMLAGACSCDPEPSGPRGTAQRCSYGRGDADRFSDVDLHLLLAPAAADDFRADAEEWLGALRPLVLYRLMFDGAMINALDEEGLRLDIWLHVGEEADVAGHLGSWADYEDPDEPADEDPDGIS